MFPKGGALGESIRWPRFRQDISEIMGKSSPISMDLIAANDDSILAHFDAPDGYLRKRAKVGQSLAENSPKKRVAQASRHIDHDPARTFQRSWTDRRQSVVPPLMVLIAAKGAPILANFVARPGYLIKWVEIGESLAENSPENRVSWRIDTLTATRPECPRNYGQIIANLQRPLSGT